MSVKIGEIGKIIYVYTNGFDLSSNTELGIKFTPPTGGEQTAFTRTSADGVTAPAVDSPSLPDLGVLPANEYFQYSTQADDFTDVGDWCINGEYTESTTKFYIGDDGTLAVEDVC